MSNCLAIKVSEDLKSWIALDRFQGLVEVPIKATSSTKAPPQFATPKRSNRSKGQSHTNLVIDAINFP